MPILTKGQIHVTPIGLSVDMSLAELRDLVTEHGGQVASDGGWGSVLDAPEYLSVGGERTFGVGRPLLEPPTEMLPERLKFRRYFYYVDRRALRYIGAEYQVSPNLLLYQGGEALSRAKALQAFDVVISGNDEEKLLLVTSRDRSQITNEVVDPLRILLEESGHPSTFSYDSNALNVLDPDFFLWLMFRCHRKAQVTADLVLTRLREISGMDQIERTSRLGEGVSLDRAELLAMIMGGWTEFGPAAIEFFDETLGLQGSVKIHLDGGFSPILKGVEYKQSEPDEGRAEVGMRVLDDIAYLVLPKLIHAYNSDLEWPKSDRRMYVASARDDLAALLTRLAG